jgi:hypothetical protein
MAKIRGAEGLSADQLNFELQRGGRFVVFQYTISAIILTFRRSSDIYFIRAGENAINKGIPYILLTLVAGWWGIPWGPIFTIQALITNFGGGKNVTNQVVAAFNKPAIAPAARPVPAAQGAVSR